MHITAVSNPATRLPKNFESMTILAIPNGHLMQYYALCPVKKDTYSIPNNESSGGLI
jgi:hypothetical protein